MVRAGGDQAFSRLFRTSRRVGCTTLLDRHGTHVDHWWYRMLLPSDFDKNPFCVPALLLGKYLRFNPVPRLYHANILSLLHTLSYNIFCMLHLWPSSDIFARQCQSSQVDIICVSGQDWECWGRWSHRHFQYVVVSRQLCLRLETGNRIEVELQEGVTALKILRNKHT